MLGGGITVNVAPLVAVPAGFVTAIGPDVAPAGTVARSAVSLSTVKEAGVPLKPTALTEPKPVPSTATSVPIGPVSGENELRVGGGITLKLEALVTLPAGFATVSGPDVAPTGTIARSAVSLSTVKAATAPLKPRLVAKAKLVPRTSTSPPTGPLAGAKPAIVGGPITKKLDADEEVPASFVTLIGPEAAPAGTCARSSVSLSTMNAAGVPSKATAVAVVKLVPWTDTWVPTTPLAGAKLVTAGGGVTVKLAALVAVPAGFVTWIGPVEAPVGTTARSKVSASIA
jgi:hypothetical protein